MVGTGVNSGDCTAGRACSDMPGAGQVVGTFNSRDCSDGRARLDNRDWNYDTDRADDREWPDASSGRGTGTGLMTAACLMTESGLMKGTGLRTQTALLTGIGLMLAVVGGQGRSS